MQRKAGPGKTELVQDAQILEHMRDAPAWFLHFGLEHLPVWLGALNQQFYGLAMPP